MRLCSIYIFLFVLDDAPAGKGDLSGHIDFSFSAYSCETSLAYASGNVNACGMNACDAD